MKTREEIIKIIQMEECFIDCFKNTVTAPNLIAIKEAERKIAILKWLLEDEKDAD